MYSEKFQKSLAAVEAAREKNIALEPQRMTAKQKEDLLAAFHPDYRQDQFSVLQIGPNKGDKVPTELAEILQAHSRITAESVDLENPDYETDVLIIGAGGAARAAAYVVKQLRGKACIFNRTVSKAKSIAEHFGFKYASLSVESEDVLEQYSDLIIQTTSIGMGVPSGTIKDDENQVDPIPFYTFHGHEAVYDIIYKPEETPIMLRAKAAGCKVENGYSMLLNQAYGQFSLFTGVEMNSSSKITAKY